jgi:5-methyltetrahydrofolate--homocysteine methyltransferase
MDERGKRMIQMDQGFFERIAAAVADRQPSEAAGLTSKAVDAGLPMEDVRRAILEGLNLVRRNVMSNTASLPELLLCIDTATKALAKLKEMGDTGDKKALTIVIGVVEGDPHDLGKNIISGVYRAFGYRVVDLGVQVTAEVFERAVLEHKADILALSAMMSTTMVCMPDIIRTIRLTCPGTIVLVGGAPLDRGLALKYGADGYAESAVTVLEETESVLGKSSRSKNS